MGVYESDFNSVVGLYNDEVRKLDALAKKIDSEGAKAAKSGDESKLNALANELRSLADKGYNAIKKRIDSTLGRTDVIRELREYLRKYSSRAQALHKKLDNYKQQYAASPKGKEKQANAEQESMRRAVESVKYKLDDAFKFGEYWLQVAKRVPPTGGNNKQVKSKLAYAMAGLTGAEQHAIKDTEKFYGVSLKGKFANLVRRNKNLLAEMKAAYGKL